MTRETDRPDGGYSIHLRKPTPIPEQREAAGKGKARLGEASQLIPAQARIPQAGASAKFQPVELPGEAPTELAAEPEALELDLGPEPAEELELLGPGVPVHQPPATANAAAFGSSARRSSSPSRSSLAEPLALADIGNTASAYERASQHADKKIAFKYVRPRQLEPWWRRKLGLIITSAILLGIGSYVYGCTKVMGDSIGFRRDMPELAQELHNINGRFEVLTPDNVEGAVREIASRHDLDVDRVEIIAEEIGNSEPGLHGCSPRHWPQTIQYLDYVDQMNLVKLGRICKIPEYVLTIRAHVEERWGLFHHAFHEVAYVTVHRYALQDEDFIEDFNENDDLNP